MLEIRENRSLNYINKFCTYYLTVFFSSLFSCKKIVKKGEKKGQSVKRKEKKGQWWSYSMEGLLSTWLHHLVFQRDIFIKVITRCISSEKFTGTFVDIAQTRQGGVCKIQKVNTGCFTKAKFLSALNYLQTRCSRGSSTNTVVTHEVTH